MMRFRRHDTDRRLSPELARRRGRRRATGMVVVIGLVLPVGWSYVGYLTAAGDAPFSVRSVDWLRDHGFESVVNDVEQWWYTRRRPSGSKVPASDLPTAIRHEPTSGDAGSLASDPPIATLAKPRQAGEGRWIPVTGLSAHPGAVEETYVRPDPKYPSVGVTLVRVDQAATKLVYVPGTKQPGGTGWAWHSEIPAGQRSHVFAAFNAGFKFRHTAGGVYTEGRHAVRPLQNGLAALVIRRDGTADVAKWGRDTSMGPDISTVRENLDLIVDHGAPVPGLVSDRGGRWGTIRSQLQFTWRSGLGVDAHGRLIYAAGHEMTLTELANSLARAGAVRAMQLDIHDNVVTFNWYRAMHGSRSGLAGSRLMPAMTRAADRYLAPDQRDFFTLLSR